MSSSACSDASGDVLGGEPIYDAGGGISTNSESGPAGGCPADGGTPRWQDLYSCYFTTCGSPTCHSIAGDEGSAISGFVCGSSAASCWAGMTQGSGPFFPIVPMNGAADASSTPLWSSLRVSGAGDLPTSNNMPLAPVYVFTKGDLASIRTWIQAGALNN